MAGEVELRGLCKRFDDAVAVDNIDALIHAGEFFSLLGPSGCGKTTTLRMIAGFERPTSGEILLDGVDVAQTPPHRRNVHTVFQNYALFPHLNVFDNVAFGLRRRRVAKGEVDPARQRGDRAGGAGRPGRAAPAAALRRPAAARRARPRARAAARPAAARRAARRARRQDPQAAAPRAQGAAGGGRDHVRVRDPRPGGGAQHERPGRGHEQRQDRAGGHAGDRLRGSRRPCSSPTSSASRT